jgi:hypothetical protein
MTAMIASAIADQISSWCRSEIRWPRPTILTAVWPADERSNLRTSGGTAFTTVGPPNERSPFSARAWNLIPAGTGVTVAFATGVYVIASSAAPQTRNRPP